MATSCKIKFYRKCLTSPDISTNARAIDIQSRLTEENWRTIGDPFVLKSQYEFSDRKSIAREFGNRFADTLFETDSGAWSPPIESAFGLHLVYVDDVREQTIPKFPDVKAEIAQSWLEDERQASNRKALEALLKQYEPIDAP